MRKLLLLLITAVACTSTPPPVTQTAARPSEPYALTPEEEAKILALEDRREYEPVLVEDFIHHQNSLHRMRIALALGRIGPHTFIDANGNGERDSTERQAGVDDLTSLGNDRDANVRSVAAFALGQIGDAAAAEALIQFAGDANGDVAAEAVEALSKVARKLPLERYSPFTTESQREGIRARAIRYLFR